MRMKQICETKASKERGEQVGDVIVDVGEIKGSAIVAEAYYQVGNENALIITLFLPHDFFFFCSHFRDKKL